jgi:hypothetical protein
MALQQASGNESMPTDPSQPNRVFNDDLLMRQEDLEHARRQFPTIFHVLDFPRLREKFADHEIQANKARDRVRRMGLVAVASVTMSLLVIATEPIWPQSPWTKWVGLFFEAGGMVVALFSVGGIWRGPWKERWLNARLMTERLRQWHFQLLVRRWREIDDSCKSQEAKENFVKQRDLWMDEFLYSYERHVADRLEELATEPAHDKSWLHPLEPKPSDGNALFQDNAAALGELLDAYKDLRFDVQFRYCMVKLRPTEEPIWKFLTWSAPRQLSLLREAANVFFTCAMICSAILIFNHALDGPADVERYVRTLAIGVAIIGAALKTIQGGLAPDRETERYTEYRARISQLLDRFENTEDPAKHHHLMEELELAAVEEMKGFLRTHYKATFDLA